MRSSSRSTSSSQRPPPLPAGPKAIILISDGGENESSLSQSDVVALANANSIPIFTIGVGDLDSAGTRWN